MSIEEVKELLAPVLDKITDFSLNSENEVVIHLIDFNLALVSQYLFKDLDCEVATVVATDDREKEGCFTIRYVYSYHKKNVFFIIEIKVKERFNSLANIIPALNWYEREINDMFGITPLNHPDLRPLILFPENFPQNVHPLRKDFPYNTKLEFKKYGKYEYKEVKGEGVFNILVGPIHAGIIEPGHFRFSLAGEHILQLEIRLFFKHRGIEKLAEGKKPEELLNFTDKISGDHSFAHTLAYIQAIEKLSDTKIPERAKYLRVLFAELERLMCNINDFGWLFQDVAYTFGAMNMFALKEDIMRLNKRLSGSRFNKGVLSFGGVNVDLNDEKIKDIIETVDKVYIKYEEFKKILFSSASILDRLETTGRIRYETIKDLSAVGYTARASGLYSDIRKEHPYLIYDRLTFESKIFEEGDVLARLKCRLSDIEDSISIIKQVLADLPEGDIKTNLNEIKKNSWTLGYAESQRGNIIHFVKIDEEGKIERWKIRDPSFNNWQTIQFAVLGDIVADFPIVNKSLNLSYAGNDL
ncbi:hydrogenase large subunit [Venenivibrio stagnispumantis]|uniref:Ni,Fe-hydrogenase III large subunit n=1 Tax=Venenivibrio stagnispumantis TaxID=407998 RepID=A0AA46ADN6_9AQUI|nr:NADH-quinone oxidoreductase subunit C [Venenivibrio stagnispumantis]MCW4573503.1 NADH-quinone oxidoreductase subunit C [Venenivibrio stagnispumantis]SMP06426.1 Ni,Fe-hydrogenase III large subunit [Venenivibrio stagnispumantis]